MKKSRMLKPALLSMAAVFLVVSLVSCATYQLASSAARAKMREGQPTAAAAELKVKAFTDGDDQTIYLLDYATALRLAGDYKESTKAFLKAEELTDINDYHSLSRVTGSLLMNEGMVQYKGEDYEKVYINAMLALNFLSMGDLDAAQVECRKLNDKLFKFKTEAKRDYDQDPFAFYLSAMIWENAKNWDSAYIDYKKTFERNPQLSFLRDDLVRLAWKADRPEDLVKWQKQFGGIKLDRAKEKALGEIVLVVEQGWAPQKRPDPVEPRLPRLYPLVARSTGAVLKVASVGEVRSEVVSSVESVAMKTFEDAYAALAAKRAAALATKAVVSDQIRQQNKDLGNLVWLLMNISDQADLRQWATLPATFQVAKMRLPKGDYKVSAFGIDFQGASSGEELAERTIQVVPGKKTFLIWRLVQ